MKKFEIFGDSIMKGVIYKGESGRYSLNHGSLRERLMESGVDVTKTCKMGITIDRATEMIARKFPDGTDLSNVDVLLEFGGNDSAYDWKEVSVNPMGDFQPATPKETFTDTYRKIIKRLQGMGARVFVASLVPIDAGKYLNFISKDLSKDNILKFLGDESMLYRWHESYNAICEGLARELNCINLDLRTDFLMAHNFAELICTDGIHPTEKGYKIIEERIIDTLIM